MEKEELVETFREAMKGLAVQIYSDEKPAAKLPILMGVGIFASGVFVGRYVIEKVDDAFKKAKGY